MRFWIISMQIWQRTKDHRHKQQQKQNNGIKLLFGVGFFLHNVQLCKVAIVFAVRNININTFYAIKLIMIR